MNSLTINETIDMLKYVCDNIVENEPYLTKIDSKIGDGDHGFGMKRGFAHLKVALSVQNEFETINGLFKFCGIELLKTMGGASGVLFGTMFIGGLKESEESEQLTTVFLSGFFERSLQSIMRRGKAQRGDKTMVDALAPAVTELKKASEKGSGIDEALCAATASAKLGVEDTKNMYAKFGRARQYGDKALGLQDAGATSVYLIFKSMSDWTGKWEIREKSK